MWLARYLPALPGLLPEGSIDELTPEATGAIRRAGQRLVDMEAEFHIALAKLVASAAVGARIR